MSPASRSADVMYWLMLLLGGAVLAPCLILPAWLEYRASLDLKTLRLREVARHQAEIVQLRQQREHLETDDAYVLRLARKDLNVDTPGVERIHVDTTDAPEDDPGLPASAAADAVDELAPEVSDLVERVLVRYPLARMFAHPATRPPLMIIGGGLIVSAIVLLGGPPAARGAEQG